MAEFDPNIGKETQFKPNESGNPNGRPKKIYTILKETGYSKDDIRTAFNELAWTKFDELEKQFSDPNAPAIVRVIAHVFTRAIEKGDYRYISEIIQQIAGKPKETVHNEVKAMITTVTPQVIDTGIPIAKSENEVQK